VLQLDPDHALAHLNLGLLLAKHGNAAAARAELEKASEVAPSLVEAHSALGKLAKDSQDWPTAIRELQAVIAWTPQDRTAHADLAGALQANGQAEAAAREWRLAQEPASEPHVPQ
jgi:tetratricopeptide (TPR) repeat protein